MEANGDIITEDIGPSSDWHSLEFSIDQTNSSGVYKSYLLGKNRINNSWVTLDSLLHPNHDLKNINARDYNYLKLKFSLSDSSFGSGAPMKFSSLKVNFDHLPEISILPKNIFFTPDSVLQGIPTEMVLNVNNIGYVPIDLSLIHI